MKRVCRYINERVAWCEWTSIFIAFIVYDVYVKPMFIDVEQQQQALYYEVNRPVLTRDPINFLCHLTFPLFVLPLMAYLVLQGLYNLTRDTVADYVNWFHELLGEPGGVPRPD